MNNNLEALVSNEEFLNKLADCSSAVEMQNIFSEYGAEVSLEEIEAMRKIIENMDSDELNEDSLENVSGGVCVIGPIIGAIGIAIYYKLKKRR
ncbi:MAG: hypothetical protein IJD81_11080 [Oscillospiraceae bacterium]|nr:hypothetical protein [Oscillospiraceae bacterium]